MCWKLLKTLQVEPKDETDFPVRALTHFDVYTFILCSLGLCCEVFISLLPCGQLLMSSCLFEKLSLSVFRLTVLPHTCSSLICRFSHDLLFPRHSRCSPPPSPSPTGQLIHFIVCCLCRSTLGGAFLPWTNCVWVYLLQRWAALPPNHTSFLLGSLRWLRCWCRSPHTLMRPPAH